MVVIKFVSDAMCQTNYAETTKDVERGPIVFFCYWLVLVRLLGVISTFYVLQWRHKERDGVSNHQPHGCLLNRIFKAHIKEKKSKLRVTGLCAGNSPVTGEFPAQRVSNAENISIWSSNQSADPLALTILMLRVRIQYIFIMTLQRKPALWLRYHEKLTAANSINGFIWTSSF